MNPKYSFRIFLLQVVPLRQKVFIILLISGRPTSLMLKNKYDCCLFPYSTCAYHFLNICFRKEISSITFDTVTSPPHPFSVIYVLILNMNFRKNILFELVLSKNYAPVKRGHSFLIIWTEIKTENNYTLKNTCRVQFM